MKYQQPHGISDPDAPYINGDPTIARQGSIPPAASIEFPQREIVNFIKDSDQIPTDNDLHQLMHGVRNQRINFGVDTGSANLLSVTLSPPLLMYKQGTPVRALIATTNTGATTININGLGARPVHRANGAELEGGDLVAGGIATLIDDGSAFQLMNYLGSVTESGDNIVNNYNTDIPYAEDSYTTPLSGNAVVVSYTPAITTPQPGDLIEVKVKNTNQLAGPTAIYVNALAGKYICRTDGQHLQIRDLEANETILLEYHTTYWQMMRLVRSQVYFKITQDLTLWVRTDGNDANDGSANDALHAFLTVQGAINFARNSFLIAGRSVYIRLGTGGTYHGAISVSGFGGTINIIGDYNNRAGYVLAFANAGSDLGVITVTGANCNISGVTLYHNGGTAASTLYCGEGSFVTVRNVTFSGVGDAGDDIWVFGSCYLAGGIDFIRGYVGSCIQVMGGQLLTGPESTVFYFGNVTMGIAFVYANSMSLASFTYPWVSMAGGAFGRKFYVSDNSMIKSHGGGPDYLAGNSPGVNDGTGHYL